MYIRKNNYTSNCGSIKSAYEATEKNQELKINTNVMIII